MRVLSRVLPWLLRRLVSVGLDILGWTLLRLLVMLFVIQAIRYSEYTQRVQQFHALLIESLHILMGRDRGDPDHSGPPSRSPA